MVWNLHFFNNRFRMILKNNVVFRRKVMSSRAVKRYVWLFSLFVVMFFACAGVVQNSAFAADDCVANFSWLPNTESDLAGYRIYYGTTHGGPYPNVAEIGKPDPVDGRIHGSVTGLSDGVSYYFVCVAYNTANMQSEYSAEATHTCPAADPDVTSPTGSITINGGAASTEVAGVVLTLSASDSESAVAQMKFSNNNVDWSTPESYAASKSWTLSSGLGTKTVYVKFSDEAGNWSTAYSDAIELVESSGESSSKVFGSASGADYPGTIEDTYINLNEENNSNRSYLNTYTWPVDSVANAIIMKINLAGIPADAQILSAVLSVYMNGVEDDGGDDAYEVSVHKIINHNPQLSACTGYTYDGTHEWTPNDSCYNSIPMAQADLASAEDSQLLDKTPGYKSWNVTNMVREWVANPGANFGLLLNSDPVASSSSNRIFSSSEAEDPGQRPKLVVTYTTSGGGSSTDTTPPAPPSGLGVGVHY